MDTSAFLVRADLIKQGYDICKLVSAIFAVEVCPFWREVAGRAGAGGEALIFMNMYSFVDRPYKFSLEVARKGERKHNPAFSYCPTSQDNQ